MLLAPQDSRAQSSAPLSHGTMANSPHDRERRGSVLRHRSHLGLVRTAMSLVSKYPWAQKRSMLYPDPTETIRTPPIANPTNQQLCTYKGGGGPKGATPVAFPIEDASLQTDSPEARAHEEGHNKPAATSGDGSGRTTAASGGGGGLLDDPQSLLAAIKHSATDEDGPAAGTTATAAATNGDDSEETPPSSATTATTPAGEPGQGPAAALGLKTAAGAAARGGDGGIDATSASAKRGILLPGALAGLASAGSSSSSSSRDIGSRGAEGRRGGANRPGQGKRGPLISEIVPETAKDSPAAARGEEGLRAKKNLAVNGGSGNTGNVGKGGGRRPSVVKKGFLSSLPSSSSSSCSKAGGKGQSERAPLYPPSGSENGSEPSAYVKLMSRCKVVDTRDHSKEEVRLSA